MTTTTCLGPWQVDLAAIAVEELRFNRPGTHTALSSAYGYDVRTDPSWPLFRAARELTMVAAAVPLLASTPSIASSFRTRLRTIIQSDQEASWSR